MVGLAGVIGSINTFASHLGCFLLHFLPITSDFHSQDALAGMQSRQDGIDDSGQISLLLLSTGSKYPLFFSGRSLSSLHRLLSPTHRLKILY